MSSRVLRSRFTAVTVVFGALAFFAAGPAAAEGAPGDLWEVSSKMSMAGMDMALPPRVHKTCMPKEWTAPPATQDGEQTCKVTDFSHEGDTYTWKTVCENPSATGEGRVKRTGPDTYTGTMKVESGGHAMTIELSGKRIGECDDPK